MNIFLSTHLRKEKNNIIHSTILEHNKKHGDNCCRKIEYKYNIQLLKKYKTTRKLKRLIME